MPGIISRFIARDIPAMTDPTTADRLDLSPEDYQRAVDELLEQRYGLTSNESDRSVIASAHAQGQPPEQFVEAFADRYKLTRIEDLGLSTFSP